MERDRRGTVVARVLCLPARGAPTVKSKLARAIACLATAALTGCAGGAGQTRPEAPATAPQAAIDPRSNYCFTRPDGRKTWNSFILRNDVLKVSPRATDRRVAHYVPAGGLTWRDRDGPATYTFAADGRSAVWRANNARGTVINLRRC